MKMSLNLVGKAALGGIVGVLAAGPASFAQAQDVTEMNILTANHESCSIYPQFVAAELGLNEELGIRTNLLNSDTTIPFVAFLQTRDADVVMLDSSQVLQMADKEPVGAVVYEAYQYAPEGIVVPADGPIQGLSELRDTTIGLASDRDQITTIIALDSIGETLDSMNVETVVVGDSGPVFAKALIDGTIEAFAGGSSDRAYLEAAGFEFRNITPAAVSENPGNSLAVSRDRMDEMNDQFSAFLKGWAMAQHAGVVDTKAVVEVCRVAVPEQFEDMEAGAKMINLGVYTLQLRRTMKYGTPQADVWERIQGPYVKLGEISRQIPASEFTDDRYIDAANDFTALDVKNAIAKWREANPDKVLP